MGQTKHVGEGEQFEGYMEGLFLIPQCSYSVCNVYSSRERVYRSCAELFSPTVPGLSLSWLLGDLKGQNSYFVFLFQNSYGVGSFLGKGFVTLWLRSNFEFVAYYLLFMSAPIAYCLLRCVNVIIYGECLDVRK